MATTNLAAQPVREFQPATIAEAPIGGRVVIVDQQALMAESLALVLHTAEVATSITREGSIEAVVRHVRAFDPDLVLVSATSGDAIAVGLVAAPMATGVATKCSYRVSRNAPPSVAGAMR